MCSCYIYESSLTRRDKDCSFLLGLLCPCCIQRSNVVFGKAALRKALRVSSERQVSSELMGSVRSSPLWRTKMTSPSVYLYVSMSNEVTLGQAGFVPQFGQMFRASGKHSCLAQVVAPANVQSVQRRVLSPRTAERGPLVTRELASINSFQPHLQLLDL